MDAPAVKALFLPQAGTEEPWLDDVRVALGQGAELAVFDANEEIAPQFVGVRVVIDQGGHASRAVIDAGAAAGVELWQVLGTGLDHTDIEYILGRGIKLANTPGPFSAIALAEHAMYLMLNVAKKMREADRNLRAGTMYLPVTEELYGSTLGLVGLGASARELAVRARAFGMRVIAIDLFEPSAVDLAELGVDWYGSPAELARLLEESDYVSIHVPLTRETRHMIDAEMLARMKPTAVLINVARGAIVDEDALAAALRDGRLRAAGIDAYSVEPPPPDHPFLTLDNVVPTPHVAGVTYGTSRRRGVACAENTLRVGRGEPPLYQVTSAA
jgi:D-3-phosphoglycerate dehydrogenase / 2-oxoglutarate reductase